jgi:hypothetical protein
VSIRVGSKWPHDLHGRRPGARIGCAYIMAAKTIAVTLVVALAARPLAAYPNSVGCSRSITSGTMMGQAISTNGAPGGGVGSGGGKDSSSDAQQIQLAKGGATIACGGTLTAGDTGLTLVKGSSGSQYRECIPCLRGAHASASSLRARASHRAGTMTGIFSVAVAPPAVIETEMSVGTGSWGIISGTCSMQRIANRCMKWSRASPCVSFACVDEADTHAPHTVRHGDAITDSCVLLVCCS